MGSVHGTDVGAVQSLAARPADVSAQTLDRAERAAAAAIRRARVRIEPLHDMQEFHDAVALVATVWDMSVADCPFGPELLKAMAHVGNYIVGVHDDEGLVGVSVGFLGTEPRLSLHSNLSGVLARARDRGIGFALKTHQRAWALSRGIDAVTWTFDPLVRRNAYFNLTKLGASVTGYVPEFYGVMAGVNRGDESDRFTMLWDLPDPRVADACEGTWSEPALPDASGEARVLVAGDDGAPRRRPATGPTLACFVPDDIVGLRLSDPAAALAWRRALRQAVVDAMERGYRVTGITRSGYYVLAR